MTDTPKLLICNPDLPGWFHGNHHVGSIATARDCQHQIRISAAGVGVLLTTPGLETCCWYCIPGDLDDDSFVVLPEIAEFFKQETGQELTENITNGVRMLAMRVARGNRRRGR
jgi:hypothetical protein